MTYILDSGFFILCRNYYLDIFPSVWKSINLAYNQKRITSVEQVEAEIKRYGGKQDHLLDWIKSNQKLFAPSSGEELKRVREIFLVPNFKALIDRKEENSNMPCADPFVIAKAWALNGTVVTREIPRREQSAPPKIPDVCKHFDIPCITPHDFMREMSWSF